jgi:hypothetical protein
LDVELSTDIRPVEALPALLITAVVLSAMVLEPLVVTATVTALAGIAVAIFRPAWVLNLLLITLPAQGIFVFSYGANFKISELLGCGLIFGIFFRALFWREALRFNRQLVVPLAAIVALFLLSNLNLPRFAGEMVLSPFMTGGKNLPGTRGLLITGWAIYSVSLAIAVATVLDTAARIRRAADLLLCASCLAAVVGILQWVHLVARGGLLMLPGATYHLGVTHSAKGGFPRSPGTFSEPSTFALFLVALLPLSLVWLFSSRSAVPKRRWTRSLVALQVGSLLLSFSVSGFVLFAAVLMFVIYQCTVRKSAGWLAAASRTALMIAIVVLVLVLLGQFAGVYATDINEFVAQRIFGRADSAEERFLHSRIAWNMGTDHFLTGVGVGNYPFLVASYASRMSIRLREFIVPTPGNIFLLILAENGVIGLAALMVVLVRIYKMVASSTARLQDAELQHTAIAIYGSLFAILLSFVFLDNLFANYFWVLLGLAVALHAAAGKSAAELQHPAISPGRQSGFAIRHAL